MNPVLLLVVILTILFGFLFLLNIFFIAKIKNKKKVLITYLYIFLCLGIFYLFAYCPRIINRKYLKDDVTKIYCCYSAYDSTIGGYVIEINNKKDDVIKKMKKVYYFPYYRIRNYKSILENCDYFILQYSNYYVLIGEYGWKYVKGQYIEYYGPLDSYSLIHSKGASTKDMKNFDFEELKKQFT